MNTDFQIKINNQFYSRDWILDNFRKLDRAEYSEAAFCVFEFLYKWFSGKEAFEIHTSGSTGSPKVISIKKKQMILSAEKTLAALNLQPGNNALLCISPKYIGGLMMIVRSLIGNLRLTVIEPTGNPFQQISDEFFDFTALVPLQLEQLLKDKNSLDWLNQMKSVIVGGARISPRLEAEVRKLKPIVYQTFGMTETISHIALRRISGSEAEKNYKVLPGVKIGQDKRGCLVIESDILGGQTLVTNDLVNLVSSNIFGWIGRFDDIINSGGVKINPEKVEQAILELVSDPIGRINFLVGGLPDNALGQKVVAVFEKSFQSIIKKDALLKALNSKLSAYEVPKEIYFVDKLATTSAGKVSRSATIALVER